MIEMGFRMLAIFWGITQKIRRFWIISCFLASIYVVFFLTSWIHIWDLIKDDQNLERKLGSKWPNAQLVVIPDLSDAFDLFQSINSFKQNESLLYETSKCFIPFIKTSRRKNFGGLKYVDVNAAIENSRPTTGINSKLDNLGSYLNVSNGESKNPLECLVKTIEDFNVKHRIVNFKFKTPFDKIHSISKPFQLGYNTKLFQVNCIERTNNKCSNSKANSTLSPDCKRKKQPQVVQQYERIHYSIPSRKNISNFWRKFENISNSNTKPPPSIVLIGIESLISVNFKADLPKTYKVISQYLKQFPGFTSLGMEKLENLIPLLTGIEYGKWKEYCDTTTEKDPNFSCDIDTIGKVLRSLHYETVYAENLDVRKDTDGIHVYQNLKKYFDILVNSKHEGIHSFQPYQIAKLFSMQNQRLPLSTWNQYEEMFEFVTTFWRKFDTELTPTYSNIWIKDYFKNKKLIDKYLSAYSKTILQAGRNKNTLILFYGTTSYFGQESLTKEFYEEELNSRLPVLYAYFPKTLAAITPRFNQIFEDNTKRLISIYDLHETLNVVIGLGIDSFTRINGIQKKLKQVSTSSRKNEHDTMSIHGSSLIDTVVPMNRTCSSTRTPTSLCPCSRNGDRTLSPISSHITAIIIAKRILTEVYKDLAKDSEFRSLCMEWEFKQVLNATRIEKGESRDLYEIYFLASPSDAMFKTNFYYKSFQFQHLKTTFKRMNPKPDEAYCIGEPNNLTKVFSEFCYCNE